MQDEDARICITSNGGVRYSSEISKGGGVVSG